jgi:hypothetical protein
MTKSELDLGWNNDHERQSLWVQLESWQYKVFIESFESHRTIFQFEGVVSGGWKTRLTGLKLIGEIEIPMEILHPEWGEQPPDNPGTFNLVDKEGDTFVSVTLLVSPESFADLFRVFSEAFGNNGDLGLELVLKHSKGAEPNFWRTGWQHEDIQVYRFGLYFDGRLREPNGLVNPSS